MDFRTLASAEASALVRRLMASGTEQSARELKSLRQSIDAAVQSLEAALHAQPATDKDVATLVERLTELANSEMDAAASRVAADADERIERANADAHAAVERATAEAAGSIEKMRAELKAEKDRAAASVEQMRAALHAETDKANAMRATLKEETDKRDALRASLKDATDKAAALQTALKAETDKLAAAKTALKTEQDQAASLRNQIANAGTARAVAEAARKTAEGAAQRAAAQVATLEKEIGEALQEVETLRADIAHSSHDRQAAHTSAGQVASLEVMLAEAQARIVALETTHAEDEARIAELDASSSDVVEQARTARGQALALAFRPLDRLRAAVEKLSAATDVDDVLAMLADALTSEFSRIAAFRMSANSLEGSYQAGFESERDISKVIVPLNLDSPVADAARTGEIQQLMADSLTDNGTALFGGTPTLVVTFPVIAGGDVIAVLYADDSGEPVADPASVERRVKYADVLLAVASPILSRLAVEDTAVSEFRDYAIQLVRDLESVYTADMESGMPRKDVRARLQHNIDYARRVFKQRVEPKGPRAAGLLERQIGLAVAEKHPAPFAADLAAVAGIDIPMRAAKRSAKAS